MKEMSFKEFMNKILSGAAMGIVVGLIPNAIFGEIFKALSSYHVIFAILTDIVFAIQFTVPVLVGMFTALEFKLSGIQTAAVVGAAFVGSGAATYVDTVWTLSGTGDLINTMITVGIAIIILKWFGSRLANLAVVIIPILGGVLPGLIGLFTLTYVSQLTGLLGNVIANFTTLQPLVMVILLAVTFGIIIVTPLSTVALAYAISLAGLGAGAANVGIVATLFTLAYGSSKVNNPGSTFALFFAGPKMFMANFLQNPIMTLPIIINTAVTGLAAFFFKTQGTTASAGFGITGLAGPINAYSLMPGATITKLIILVVQYLVVPLAIAVVTHTIFVKMDLYDNEIFKLDQGVEK